jgi:hypothetical protein
VIAKAQVQVIVEAEVPLVRKEAKNNVKVIKNVNKRREIKTLRLFF